MAWRARGVFAGGRATKALTVQALAVRDKELEALFGVPIVRLLHTYLVPPSDTEGLASGLPELSMPRRRGPPISSDFTKRHFAGQPGSDGYPRSVHDYNDIIEAVTASNKGWVLRDIYEDMLMDGIVPNRHTWLTLISGATRTSRMHDVFYFFEQNKLSGITPDLSVYNAVLSAWARCSKAHKAAQVLAELEQVGLQPNQRTYLALLSAYASSGMVEQVISLMNLMQLKGHQTGPTGYAALITAYKNRVPWTPESVTKVFEILEEARDIMPVAPPEEEEGLMVDHDGARKNRRQEPILVYSAAALCFVHNNRHDDAMKVMDMMAADGIKPDYHFYRTLIESYLQRKRIPEGVALMERMSAEDISVQIDIIMSLVEASVKNRDAAEYALRVLDEFEKRNLFFTLKHGSDLLATASRHAPEMRVAHRLYDILIKNPRSFPTGFGLFEYMQGMTRTADPAYASRLEEVSKHYFKLRPKPARGREGESSSGQSYKAELAQASESAESVGEVQSHNESPEQGEGVLSSEIVEGEEPGSDRESQPVS